ncbi:MAG: SPOR domain-containing protein [Aestuariivirga sp.]|uniref:SPOR domain-containing protein n=1 Tax=Aestuariivirga sp. TaxID=2650926 RepID=UPI0025C30473|nr:SPOR domain-containing protein [Aestuariivirga sp.]MCA3560282.1 SPOR domain-containing protein [Aestuariivirga sp.]
MSIRTLFLASVCCVVIAASTAPAWSAASTPETKLAAEAYKALQAGDAETAVSDYSRAIDSRALPPDVLANALMNRGLAYQRLNEHEFAIDDYTAALRIDALSAKVRALALYNRGLSYQRLGRNAAAVEDYTSALFLDASFSHAYYSRGTLLRGQGQYLFALADFDKALSYDYPEPARVYVAQASTFEKLNRSADARDALHKALDAKPGYEPALQRLAALDGALAAAAQGDEILTSATSPASDQLPVAKAPPAALMGADAQASAASSPKLFTDRVPQEQPVRVAAADPVPDVQPGSGAAEEKVLAVEDVPADDQIAAPAEPAAPAMQPAETQAAEAAPPTPPGEPAPQPKITGWSVQLASATSEDSAWSTWKKMQARNKALAAQQPVVVRADLGTKGIFYRVRLVGFDSQEDAGKACSRLKSKGVNCFISKASS